MDSCSILVLCPVIPLLRSSYLHGAAQTEDAVVGLLRLEALEGGLDNVVLLGEQVIGPVRQSALAHPSVTAYVFRPLLPSSTAHMCLSRGCVPQSELPVSRSVAVPVGERLHPALQPRALVDEWGERRRRHVFGDSAEVRGCQRCGLQSIADCRGGEVGVGVFVRRKRLNANWGRVRPGRAWTRGDRHLIQRRASLPCQSPRQ